MEAYMHSIQLKGIKCCEFLLLKNKKLYFIEAKENCPNQIAAKTSEEKRQKYQQYVHDIAEKMQHSLAMYANILLGQYDGAAVPEQMRRNLLADKEIRLVLVVKNAEKAWLVPLKEVLEKQLRNDLKIWKIKSFVVINEETAYQKHFIAQISANHNSDG